MDNLVLLHSQSEGRSRVYDLQLASNEQAVEVIRRGHQQSLTCFCLFSIILSGSMLQAEGGPALVHPSLPATAICRQVLEFDRNLVGWLASIISINKDSGHSQPLPYSPSWVVFRPNVLVDARTGVILVVVVVVLFTFLCIFFVNILVTGHDAKLHQKESSTN